MCSLSPGWRQQGHVPCFQRWSHFPSKEKPVNEATSWKSQSRNPQSKATAICGNLFSYMPPWESVMTSWSISWQQGDLAAWPLDQVTCCDIIRIQLARGHEALIDHVRALTARSQIVKQISNLYINSHFGISCAEGALV